MILARVVGTVVATRKDERLHGKKLLMCRPVNPAGEVEGAYFVAVDTVGAGSHEMVLIVTGSSARMAAGHKESPIDSSIVGIVDEVRMDADSESDDTRAVAAAAPAKSRRP
ncbi:MAG TPA: EutN/CcmL family microcompartment protein [Terriglobales bacterium]|nr:EutN/CcmL family microcompartment protein [Terriglobales bacterium]